MTINRQAVFDKTTGRCAYCGCPLKFANFQVDHLFPQCRAHMYPKDMAGGVDAFLNLFPTCAKCNNYKHAMFLETFRSELEKQITRLKKSAQFDRALRYEQVEVTEKPIVFYFETLFSSAGLITDLPRQMQTKKQRTKFVVK